MTNRAMMSSSRLQVMLLLLFPLVLAQEQHFLVINSTCHGRNTDWNQVQVGRQIKDWISSIKAVDSDVVATDSRIRIEYLEDNSTDVGLIEAVDDNMEPIDGFVWLAPDHNPVSNFLNGFYYGKFDPDSEDDYMTGNNIVFLYPDMETALVGHFVAGEMKAARQTRVVAERCQGNIKEIKVAQPDLTSALYQYKRPNSIRFSGDPLQIDPYERKAVIIRDSPFGDTLFSRRAFAKNELVAYYAGMIYDKTWHSFYHDNQTLTDQMAIHTNVITLDDRYELNIMPEYKPLWRYRSTLAHKINHSFTRNNTKFTTVYHPRFGKIIGIWASKDIRKNEELFVYYGYDITSSLLPKWYLDTYRREVGPYTPLPDQKFA